MLLLCWHTSLQAESAEPSDDAIKRTLDYLHDRAQGATYFVASDPGEHLRCSHLVMLPLSCTLAIL
jgi:hypothetical protein